MSLIDKVLHFDTLFAAWSKVRANAGAAGGDGVTVGKFGRNAGRSLHKLAEAIRSGEFEPGPCRRVDIPKKQGGFRTLMIPPILDRVLHSAIAETLEPILDPTFEESSFAYRHGKSVKQAVARIEMWRDKGYAHVIEADIVRYFDNVRHDLLLNKLAIVLEGHDDGRLTSLIADLLDAQGVELGTIGIGLAQGSPLSPILANLYLDALDEAIDRKGIKLVRFADDFVILCKSEMKAEAALNTAMEVLDEHGLTLQDSGTRMVSFEEGFDFLGYLFVRSLALKQQSSGTTPPPTVTRIEPISQPEDPMPVPDGDASGRYDRGAGVLYLNDPGHALGLRNRGFAVLTKNGYEVAAIPHRRIGRIEVGPNIRVQWDVIDHCVSTDTDLALINGLGAQKAVLTQPSRLYGALHLKQAAAVLDPEFRVRIARSLVEARIRNQRTQLSRLNRKKDNQKVRQVLSAMGRNLRKISEHSDLDQLKGYEVASGALYWPALGELISSTAAPFRRTRPAEDMANAVVNYLTGVLERDIRAAILGANLHTGFGFLHSANDYSEAAIYDLMEPFRAPLTEGLAAFLINARRVRREMFDATDETMVQISVDGRRAIIAGYEQAIAKRVNITGRKGKLAWRPMMLRQAYDLAKAVRKGDPVLFNPYLMEA